MHRWPHPTATTSVKEAKGMVPFKSSWGGEAIKKQYIGAKAKKSCNGKLSYYVMIWDMCLEARLILWR